MRSSFNFGVQQTCTIGKCPGIHTMVVLRNKKCGVEEHRVQACNEVVWAITRSVRVQPSMTRTIAHHTFDPVGFTQPSGEVTRRCTPVVVGMKSVTHLPSSTNPWLSERTVVSHGSLTTTGKLIVGKLSEFI